MVLWKLLSRAQFCILCCPRPLARLAEMQFFRAEWSQMGGVGIPWLICWVHQSHKLGTSRPAYSSVPEILPDLGHHVPVLSCYGLNCILPLNSCVEALTRNVTVFENWAYKEVILVNWGPEALIQYQFSSVTQLYLTLCDPMNQSTPGLPVHYQLPEFTQTHVHRVSDAIQPSHPLLSPSLPAPNPSQHQGHFQWANSSHEVAKVLEIQYN